jgi:hypothetical protein
MQSSSQKSSNIECWFLSMQMAACMHDPVDGRGANQIPPATKCQVRSKHCTQPLPTSSIYCHAHNLRPFHVSPPRMACIRAWPRWGGKKQIPPPMPSTVMPRYDKPVCLFNKILTKQKGRTCWPCCLPFRQILGLYTSWNSGYIQIHIEFFTIVREEHLGPLLKSGKSCQHMACWSLKTA